MDSNRDTNDAVDVMVFLGETPEEYIHCMCSFLHCLDSSFNPVQIFVQFAAAKALFTALLSNQR